MLDLVCVCGRTYKPEVYSALAVGVCVWAGACKPYNQLCMHVVGVHKHTFGYVPMTYVHTYTYIHAARLLSTVSTLVDAYVLFFTYTSLVL